MADNKNQHFVPRCHLKPFTVNGAGKGINLFNLDADRAIAGAPVKSQCSRDYFYGQDPRLEAAIQAAERDYAATVRRLLADDAIPTDADRHNLRRFILLQYLRTEAASQRASRIAADLAALPEMLDEPYDPKAMMLEAVQGAMRYYAETPDIIDDLQVSLVRNRTRIPFHTSDDPAVLTNRWYLQSYRARGLNFGIKHAGAILLLPLSPDALVVLHDPDVYTAPHRDGVIDITRDDDATALNAHQTYNCAANLYFNDWATHEAVSEAIRTAARERPAERHRVTYAVRDAVVGEHVRYEIRPLADIIPDPERDVLIHSEHLRARPARWPRLLSYRAGGRMYSNGSRTGYVRRWPLEMGLVSGGGYRVVRI